MSRRTLTSGTDWPEDCHTGIEETIAEFKRTLPGWWYSLGECQVSCDASCAPTKMSADIELIDIDKNFDAGFHVDILQPNTLSQALRAVMEDALDARRKALAARAKGSSETRAEDV